MPRPPSNPTACRVLENVMAHPGIHFRGLKRAAQVTSAGQLRHHIDRLVRQGHIIEVGDGGFMRFFAAGAYDRRLRQQMTRFSRPIPRRVARLLLRGGMTRTNLRKALGCADSTLGYYLSRMHREGILYKHQEAASQHYALADPETVRQVLQAQDAPATLPGQRGRVPAEGTDGGVPTPGDGRDHPLPIQDGGRDHPLPIQDGGRERRLHAPAAADPGRPRRIPAPQAASADATQPRNGGEAWTDAARRRIQERSANTT